MRTSKFVNLDPNVLLEWIYDDDNFLAEDYNIVVNTLQETRSFVNAETTNSLPSSTNNFAKTNLFELDIVNKKWAPVDTVSYPFLQLINYPGNIPYRYDIVKLHFPINYTFSDKVGLLLNVNVLDRTGKIYLNLSNFFYDKTDSTRSLEYTAPPFLYNEKLWGKYLEIQVPAPVALSQDVSLSDINSAPIPTLGGINSNLAGPAGLGVGPNSPIFIDFSFLTKKETIVGKISYTVQDPFGVTIPQIPEFQTLAVQILKSTEGDWFEISGIYDGTVSGFATFIEQQSLNNNDQYAIYTVNVYEKNLLTDTVQYIVQDSFDDPIRFRPIITFSTTTAVIDVELKLISTVSGDFITRNTNYVMIQDEVAKYGRNLTKINVANAFKPKIYQSSPDKVNVTTISNNASVSTVEVPFPVMFERFNIVAKNVSEQINDTVFYGIGQLQILLYPAADNVIKITIASKITDDGYTPFVIPTGTRVVMIFKSDTLTVEAELYNESGQVDYANGVVVFRIIESQIDSVRTIFRSGFDQFYIVMKPSTGVNTMIYSGRYLIFSEF